MSRKWRNFLIGVLAVAVIATVIWLLGQGPSDFRAKYEGTDLSTDVSGIGRSNTYDAYVASFAGEPAVREEVAVDLSAFEGDGEVRAEGLFTPDDSEITWTVDVPQAGLYNIRLD